MFVTGATGFVGSRLLRLAATRPELVTTGLVRRGQLAPGVTRVEAELHQADLYRRALGPSTVVIHLAAVTGKAPRAAYRQVNVDGTRILLDAAGAARVRGFILVSSVAAGYRDQRFAWYAKSKAAAEELVARSGLPYLIARPTQVIGPGSPVGASMTRLANLPLPIVFGRGDVRVQPIEVDDLAERLLALADGPFDGRTVTLGGPAVLTMRDWMAALRTGSERRPVRVPLEPLRTLLGLVEPVMRPVLPFTAGQLSAFANDGAADAAR